MFKNAIKACIENGERLADDASLMLDFDRVPTAYALAILAQEECAKALLLNLVSAGALPWSNEVQRALNDHRCKQLAMLILDHLCPEFEEWRRRHVHGNWEEALPKAILDATNLIVHERIPRETSRWWITSEDRPLEHAAKAIAEGKLDRAKQDAFYVGVGSTGQLTSTPSLVTREQAELEVSRAKRFGSDLRSNDEDPKLPTHADSEKLLDVFRLLTGKLSPEEFMTRWRVV